MNKHRSRFLKALLLTTVFSLNIVVSFACSVSETVHHSHHAGNRSDISHHSPGKAELPGHGHEGDHKHHHGHDDEPGNKQDESKNCCSGDVVKLQQTDRSVSRGIDLPEQAQLTLIHTIRSEIDATLFVATVDEFLPQHFRWRLSTIPDIRIAIQSFQI
jgi:hypothetical protein